MSVINKMLRDLDQRNSALAVERKGTSSIPHGGVPVPRPRRTSGPWLRWELAAILVAAASGFWFFWPSVPNLPVVQVAPVAVPVATPPAPPASVPPAAVAAVPAVSAPAQSPPTPATLPVAVLPQLAKTIPVEPGKTSAPATSQVPASALAPAPAPEPAQRQQQAGRDALVQAQTLWNSGAREAAIDLLQQAVATAERSAPGGASGMPSLLVPLVRELTRMQLADGRPGSAWDLLTRLEPQLRNEPELWAVRGNAAQRLGRHQDSVHAYMVALQSRPGEQRWLLGAAVSLAALGQTSSAAEMVDKAQAVGTISREVQAYLKQMGVPFKD